MVTEAILWQYITWISSGTAAWTLKEGGMAADNVVEIGPRPIPQEPMVSFATCLSQSSSHPLP